MFVPQFMETGRMRSFDIIHGLAISDNLLAQQGCTLSRKQINKESVTKRDYGLPSSFSPTSELGKKRGSPYRLLPISRIRLCPSFPRSQSTNFIAPA
jgi:hypothetical protein